MPNTVAQEEEEGGGGNVTMTERQDNKIQLDINMKIQRKKTENALLNKSHSNFPMAQGHSRQEGHLGNTASSPVQKRIR